MQLLMIYRQVKIFRTINEYSGNTAFMTATGDQDAVHHEDLDDMKTEIDLALYQGDDDEFDQSMMVDIINGDWES